MIAAAEPSALEKGDINLSWLLMLRWGAVVGQLSLILGVQTMFAVRLPIGPLVGISAVAVATNIFATWSSKKGRPSGPLTIALMLLDVGLLTALLYFSGGPHNPFSTLYLVNIALAAIVLPAAWTWTIVALSMTGFGALFFFHQPVVLETASAATVVQLPLYLPGTWVSFSIAAIFIVYFAIRVSNALATRESELAAARDLAARTEKLASLATLAAGAAHELSTPLSTIAVVAKELERHLERGSADPTAIEDARLIREQVVRCRSILDHMSADAGASAGEGLETSSAESLIDEALDGLEGADVIDVDVDDSVRDARLFVPPRSFSQALRSVLKNARDASGPTGRVRLRVIGNPASYRFEVRDRGTGMPPEVLARVGEPFFTTKEPGRGMGLGLFLSRAVLEGLGGMLEIDSEAGQGTTVVLILPRSGAEPT